MLKFINGQPTNKSHFTNWAGTFDTLYFDTDFNCNYFLENNPEYGFIGKDSTGKIHVAKNSDKPRKAV